MARRILLVATLAFAGCAPTLLHNQTFLVSEDLKLTSNGFVSLKSTGETFDLSPICRIEGNAERVAVAKVHGSYIVTGDGFKRVWRLWPSGRDEAKYEPVDFEPGPSGFQSPAIEIVGNCAVVHWDRDGSAAAVYVTSDGDADENKCKDE